KHLVRLDVRLLVLLQNLLALVRHAPVPSLARNDLETISTTRRADPPKSSLSARKRASARPRKASCSAHEAAPRLAADAAGGLSQPQPAPDRAGLGRVDHRPVRLLRRALGLRLPPPRRRPRPPRHRPPSPARPLPPALP